MNLEFNFLILIKVFHSKNHEYNMNKDVSNKNMTCLFV